MTAILTTCTLFICGTAVALAAALEQPDLSDLVQSELFRSQVMKTPTPFPEEGQKGVSFDLFSTPDSQALLSTTINGRPALLTLDINGLLTMIPVAKQGPADNGTDAIAATSDPESTTDQMQAWITSANGVNFLADMRQSTAVIEGDEEGLMPRVTAIGVMGLSPRGPSFAEELLKIGLVDSPVVRITLSNQFLDSRSQIQIGPLPDYLRQSESGLQWHTSSESEWSFQADTVRFRTTESERTKFSFDFSRPGVILSPPIFNMFIEAMHVSGLFCREEHQYLRCFSKYLIRSARFPSIELVFFDGAVNTTLSLRGDYLLFNTDRELQDGIYRLDIAKGEQEGVVLGTAFLNQFTLFLDPVAHRIGLLETGAASYFLFRNYRIQVYLNRVIFLVLIAFFISLFVTKMMRISEEGMAGFDFFSANIFE